MIQKGLWKTISGPKLLRLITAVSAVAISYEGMSQGVMGAVNVAPEYGVWTAILLNRYTQSRNRELTYITPAASYGLRR
jgi:hypothetical protein